MSNLTKDILIGGLFLIGLIGFISGEFILSSMFFGTAVLVSNMDMKAGRVFWSESQWMTKINAVKSDK
jgi:hypothetical protein